MGSKASDAKLRCFNALETLLKRKKFENIYTNEILETAGVSRSQFYRMFQDKYDLLDQLINRQVELVYTDECELTEYNERFISFLTLIKHNCLVIAEHNKYDKYVLMEKYFEIFYNLFKKRMKRIGKKEVYPTEDRAIRYTAAGIARLIFDWLESGCAEGVEVIAKDVVDNISEKINQLAQR